MADQYFNLIFKAKASLAELDKLTAGLKNINSRAAEAATNGFSKLTASYNGQAIAIQKQINKLKEQSRELENLIILSQQLAFTQAKLPKANPLGLPYLPKLPTPTTLGLPYLAKLPTPTTLGLPYRPLRGANLNEDLSPANSLTASVRPSMLQPLSMRDRLGAMAEEFQGSFLAKFGLSVITSLIRSTIIAAVFMLTASIVKMFQSMQQMILTSAKDWKDLNIEISKSATIFANSESGITNFGQNFKKQYSDIFQSVIKVSNQTGISAKEISSGYYTVAQAGVKLSEAHNMISTGFKMSMLTGLDFKDVLEGVVSTSSLFQDSMNASDMSLKSLGNTIYKTAVESVTSLEQLFKALTYGAPTAAAVFGDSVDTMATTLATLGQLAQKGMRGSIGGTGLKSAIAQLLKPSGQLSSAMGYYGVNIYKEGTESYTNQEKVLKLGKEIYELEQKAAKEAKSASAMRADQRYEAEKNKLVKEREELTKKLRIEEEKYHATNKNQTNTQRQILEKFTETYNSQLQKIQEKERNLASQRDLYSAGSSTRSTIKDKQRELKELQNTLQVSSGDMKEMLDFLGEFTKMPADVIVRAMGRRGGPPMSNIVRSFEQIRQKAGEYKASLEDLNASQSVLEASFAAMQVTVGVTWNRILSTFTNIKSQIFQIISNSPSATKFLTNIQSALEAFSNWLNNKDVQSKINDWFEKASSAALKFSEDFKKGLEDLKNGNISFDKLTDKLFKSFNQRFKQLIQDNADTFQFVGKIIGEAIYSQILVGIESLKGVVKSNPVTNIATNTAGAIGIGGSILWLGSQLGKFSAIWQGMKTGVKGAKLVGAGAAGSTTGAMGALPIAGAVLTGMGLGNLFAGVAERYMKPVLDYKIGKAVEMDWTKTANSTENKKLEILESYKQDIDSEILDGLEKIKNTHNRRIVTGPSGYVTSLLPSLADQEMQSNQNKAIERLANASEKNAILLNRAADVLEQTNNKVEKTINSLDERK